MFTLTPLPYTLDALAPHISRETLEFHHGKHLQTYVDNLNKLISGTEYENMTLEAIIRSAPSGPIFNNAAQIFNHDFYFASLRVPWEANQIDSKILSAIEKKWENREAFETEFTRMALANFGSGWTWLVQKPDGTLEITNTSNALSPITTSDVPLLTADVWEHAYYIDYRNARAKYMENFWKCVDWTRVESRMIP
jgi:superoxide dismutase, Fe-Mn family